jgi:hypothetical protein
MLEICVNITAPELAGAITALATAITGGAALAPTQLPPAAATPSAALPTPSAQAQAVTPPPAPPVIPVTAAPAYSRDQIMTAGAALIDAGKMNELMTLLNAFGVQAVTQLKQEQLGAFATELRKLGAQI